MLEVLPLVAAMLPLTSSPRTAAAKRHLEIRVPASISLVGMATSYSLTKRRELIRTLVTTDSVPGEDKPWKQSRVEVTRSQYASEDGNEHVIQRRARLV